VELAPSREAPVRKDAGYAGVVVWLEPPAGTHPRIPPVHAQMVQKDKTFKPHVLAIPVGSSVDFPNYDPIFHNAFSNYDGQLFDVGLYPPGTSRSVVFKRQGVVRVFCNIHPSMSAVIIALKTPYFAVSNKSGAFAIANIPPGVYEMHVFHERATDKTLESLARSITVDNSDLSVGTISISESGYVQIPHKNKYGKEYPPVVDDFSTYPGAKK
jgi:plastocyanin